MKFNLITMVLLFVSSSVFGQNKATFSGKITNPTGDSVFIFNYKIVDGRYQQNKLSSVGLDKNGAFKMTVNIDSTVQATFTDGNENAPIILSPNDDIKMSLNTSYFDETIRYTGVGSEKNNAVIALYLIEENMNNALFEGMKDKDTTSLFSAFDTKHENYLNLVKDYKSSTPDFESYGNNILNSAERNKKQIKQYVASEIAFSTEMKKIIGKPAVDFEGVDLKGKKTKLSDYKGKIIVVDFWATWCGPCKAEFPAYKELEKKYGKDVYFVSVGTYCKEKEWNKMASDEGFEHNIYLSKEAEKQIAAYQVKYIPRYLVIDENFTLIDANAPRPSSGELEQYWVK